MSEMATVHWFDTDTNEVGELEPMPQDEANSLVAAGHVQTTLYWWTVPHPIPQPPAGSRRDG